MAVHAASWLAIPLALALASAATAQSTNPIVTATQSPGIVPVSPVAAPYGYYGYPAYPYGGYGYPQTPYITQNPSVAPITQQQQRDPLSNVPQAPTQPGATSAQGGGGGGGGGGGNNGSGSNGSAGQLNSQGPPPDANTQLVQDPRSPLFNRYNMLNAGHGPLRDQILTQTARGVGTRQGFADEIERIDALLEGPYARQLDARYDFGSVVINSHLVPPVITELHNVQEEAGPRFLFLTLGSFRIVRQARVAVEMPHWRDYLHVHATRNYSAPTVYPLTSDEQGVWDKGLAEGQAVGTREARATFNANLDRLQRDFDGMRLYQDLARKGAVSLPKVDVARRKVHVTEGGRRAFVGEEIVTMRVEPKFKSSAPARAFR